MTTTKNVGIAHIRLSEEEISAANAVLRSGALRQGRECQAFEEEFASHVGAAHAVTSASGSAALHLPFFNLLSQGDEVLVPSFTFIATAGMVSLAGGVPVFCDVDPDTFLLDLEDAGRKVTERTRMVVPVHLFGNPLDRAAVEAFAARHELAIVWDAAQAHGARQNGADVGSWGGAVAYSFYPSKNMFVGEGGMTCTDDAELAQGMRDARSHGQTGKYYHTSLGFNYRMTDVEAAIGRAQLRRLDDMLGARRRNAGILREGLAGVDGLTLQAVTPGADHAWHQFCVLVDAEACGMDRDRLGELLGERGVSTGVHYPRGLHQQPVFEELFGSTTLPVTERLSREILALPVHHGMEADDAQYVVEAVRAVLQG